MNIAFIGNYTEKKGSRLLSPLIDGCLARDNIFIFGHIGDATEFSKIQSKISLHTKYENTELRGLLERHKIDLALVLSTWAETYSMTFFEALYAGVPVITNDIGFPFYKLGRETGDHLFFESKNPIVSIQNIIKKFRKKPASYKLQAQNFAQKYAREIELSANLKYQLMDDLLGKHSV